jgi:DNA polymerase III delta prime subunit
MDLDFGRLHHAYLLVGSRGAAEAALWELFEKNGQPLKGSPDYFSFKEELFSVDDARDFAEQAAYKPFISRKVFFIAPERILHEAQNALLKTFEEPVADTHFFLVLRNENVVLPTLLSRVQIVRLQGGEESGEAKKFLSMTIKERLAFVKKFIDKEKNLSAFLDELMSELREAGASESARLEKVYRLRLSSDDRAASPRLILEHLAVVL